jgi:hypothetical protein
MFVAKSETFSKWDAQWEKLDSCNSFKKGEIRTFYCAGAVQNLVRS